MRKLISVLVAFVVATLVLVGAPAGAASRYSVTVAVSAASADVGQGITLSGKVKPAAGGERVKVQRLTGATWTTVARARLNRHSRYRATVPVGAPGDNLYRVLKPRSDGHKAGVSPVVTVVGWRWRPISGLPMQGEAAKTVVQASGILGGQSYSPFIRQDDPSAYTAQVIYVLGGMCTRLDLHVGGTAESADSSTSYAYLDATYVPEGAGPGNLFNGPVSKNSDPVHIVRGSDLVPKIATITLFASHALGDGVGWGAAMVYCRS